MSENSRPLKTVTGRSFDYDSFVNFMQKKARSYSIPDGKYRGENPFDLADVINCNSYLNGIFKSWAAVLEILSFYQDRITTEGYIMTAVEKMSVDQLLAELGFNRKPQLSASVWLAFTVISKSTSTEYRIPAGTQSQNIPDGIHPVIFETLYDFDGRPEWNQIKLYTGSTHFVSGLRTSAVCCRVNDFQPLPKKNKHLLITGKVRSQELIFFVEITDVLKLKDGSVQLSWKNPLMSGTSEILTDLHINYVPGCQNAFGFDAVDWNKVPHSEKAKMVPLRAGILKGSSENIYWNAVTSDPPQGDIMALAQTSGILSAACSKGIYFSQDSGLTWEKAQAKETSRQFHSIISDENGVFYAGGTGGSVFYSADSGFSWTLIRGNKPLTKKLREAVEPGMLPAETVNSLASVSVNYEDGHTRMALFAGTSKGLFYTVDKGRYWHEASALFSYHEDPMPENLSINEVKADGSLVTVSSSAGVYFAIINEKSSSEEHDEIKKLKPSLLHRLFHSNSPKENFFIHKNEHTAVYCSLVFNVGKEQIILLSTESGIFRLQHESWVIENAGLIREENGSLPRIKAFTYQDDIIYAASSQGIYVSRDKGISWEIQVNQFILSLPYLVKWVMNFNLGRLTADFQDVMAVYGYHFTENAKVRCELDDEEWTITDDASQIVSVYRLENGLEFNFLSDEGDTVSSVTVYEQSYYSELLTDGGAAGSDWQRLLQDYGVEISTSSTVKWYEDHQLWTIQDSTKKVSLLVYVLPGEVNVFRIDQVNCLISDEDGSFLAGTNQSKCDLNEWPYFSFSDSTIELSKTDNDAFGGDRVFLRQETPWEIEQTSLISSVETRLAKKFGKSARVTSLKLESTDVTRFSRRNLKVYSRLKHLDPFVFSESEHVPETSCFIRLQGSLPAMRKGQAISFEGRRAAGQFLKIFTDPSDSYLTGVNNSGKKVKLARPFVFTVKAEKFAADLHEGIISVEFLAILQSKNIDVQTTAYLKTHFKNCWSLIQQQGPSWYLELNDDNSLDVYREYYFPVISHDGRECRILYENEILKLKFSEQIIFSWIAAEENIPVASEISRVSSFATDGFGHITVALEKPLKNLYDPHTVIVRANLVKAVQGESINKQVLGSATEGVPFQTFKILRKPLAFQQSEDGISSDLKVYIRRSLPWGATASTLEEWHRIDSISAALPHEKCFELTEDADGNPQILFGNGAHGQIPPGGPENIIVDYRCGGGSGGNLARGAIKVLRNKPRGVKKVVNPVASEGGADAAHVDNLRSQAPASAQNTGVIISSCDYVYFSENYPGVLKASVEIFDLISKKLLLVNIQPELQLSHNDILRLTSELEKALKAASTNNMPLKVLPASPVLFDIELTVFPTTGQNWEDLKIRIITCLSAKFSLDKRKPGENVESSEIVTAAQEVNGVSGVILNRLSYDCASDKNYSDSSLKALSALRLGDGGFKGAQILTTNSDHIKINPGGMQ